MQSDSSSGENSDTPEIIPPASRPSGDGVPNIYADIAAQINQYTDRPDLLLEVIEKHDPGFIKGMNDEAREFSKQNRQARFQFGKFQAYLSAAVAATVALGILGAIFVLAAIGKLDIWILIGLAIFYAVTQSGPSGFLKVVSRLVDIVKGFGGKN